MNRGQTELCPLKTFILYNSVQLLEKVKKILIIKASDIVNSHKLCKYKSKSGRIK